LGEEYKSFSSSLCNLLHSPVTSSLLGPNDLLNTMFPNTFSFLSSRNVSDQVSHPYKTTGKQCTITKPNCEFFVFPNYESGLLPTVQRQPINLCQCSACQRRTKGCLIWKRCSPKGWALDVGSPVIKKVSPETVMHCYSGCDGHRLKAIRSKLTCVQKARSWFWSMPCFGAPSLRLLKHGKNRFDPRLGHYFLSIFLSVLNCYVKRPMELLGRGLINGRILCPNRRVWPKTVT